MTPLMMTVMILVMTVFHHILHTDHTLQQTLVTTSRFQHHLHLKCLQLFHILPVHHLPPQSSEREHPLLLLHLSKLPSD